ncbi:uncharacterized protein JCM6883_005178 [Sporobolomyces salmoneus]|uniref:uncharacterized protein n=1 Tax=Sporobolomyces salmoneus TaxID=183962 RepID=UPI00317D3B54
MAKGATIADCAISALSLVGSISILLGFAFSSQRHHIRQKVVCALGVIDMVQAADTLAGSINELRGMPFVTNSPACNASGFFYQFSTFGSACLTLIISGITFASLAHPLSSVTARLEHRFTFPIIVAITFLFSFIPAIALTATFDLVDVRGVCWFRPNTNASNLSIFIPRAFVLVCVILLYSRLLIFFQRRDMKLFGSGSNSMSQTGEGSDEAENGAKTSKRFSVVLPRRMSSWTRRSSAGSNAQKSDVTLMKGAPSTNPAVHALAPIPASPNPEPRLDTAPFSNPFPVPLPEDSHSESSSSPDSDLEGGRSTVKDSRRPSVQLSTLSQFRIDDTAARGQDEILQPHTENRRKSRGQLSPRQVNRRLSVLLMLYPLAYTLLIAVSLARLIQQLATRSNPAPALSNISRWLIYSQGMIDGLLFVVIRWVLFNFDRLRSR